MNTIARTTFLLLLISLAGCDQTANNADITRRLTEAEATIEKVKAELDSLKKSNDELQKRALWQDFFKDSANVAFLTPADQGYSTVGFDLGFLTVK